MCYFYTHTPCQIEPLKVNQRNYLCIAARVEVCSDHPVALPKSVNFAISKNITIP